jgi:hypothetical protein
VVKPETRDLAPRGKGMTVGGLPFNQNIITMINHYEFGLITIGGKSYRTDVVVFWDGAVEKWRRKESHVIDSGDVRNAIDKNPESIVIGTGEGGCAKVTDEAKKEIIMKGINLVIEETAKAASVFNEKSAEGVRVAGLFHLTC